MQLYYIRHAQSTNNALWVTTGSSHGRDMDPDLTEIGVQQADFLAETFSNSPSINSSNEFDLQNVSGFGLTHLYTSLMIRAVATGTRVAEALNLPLVGREDIHEEGGIFLANPESGEYIGQPGSSRQYFEDRFPQLVLPDNLDEDGWWNRPFEPHEQRWGRARSFRDDLLALHGNSDDRVAIFSHGGFFNYLIKTILDLPDERGLWFSMNNAAITRVDFTENGVNLVYQNRVDFLPDELIT